MNFDNSLTVRLAGLPGAVALFEKLRLLAPAQVAFARVARKGAVRWADATKRIPLADASVDVVYSSHMLEHLDAERARDFLREAARVLVEGGVLRLALPDLALLAARYRQSGDADAFVKGTNLAPANARGWRSRARLLLVGNRDHQWMYDGPSLVKMVAAAGFEGARVLSAGRTTIQDPGELDLTERADESVYVEARKPVAGIRR